MQHVLGREALRVRPSMFLGEGRFVRRPLAASDPATCFILALLCWDSRRRLRALDCAQHTFLKSVDAMRSAAQSVVSNVPLGRLQKVVLHSLHSGQPVDFDGLLNNTRASSQASQKNSLATDVGVCCWRYLRIGRKTWT